MRPVQNWLNDYGVSHKNKINKTIHWICVPAIVLTFFGFLWSIPVPSVMSNASPFLNFGTIAMVFALIYYIALSWRLAIGMAFILVGMAALLDFMSSLAIALWLQCLIIFVVSWIGQFIGHAIEGKKPSFMQDIQFLLIGPVWLLSFVYQKLNLKVSA